MALVRTAWLTLLTQRHNDIIAGDVNIDISKEIGGNQFLLFFLLFYFLFFFGLDHPP